MKLHFHPGGQYLHIACLEAQIGSNRRRSTRSRNGGQELPKLKLSVLLSTYRLSSRKTTRSPPSLIHRVKADLGNYNSLMVPRLPFTFTWTENDLFVTRSHEELSVFRIALFPNTTACPRSDVLILKNKIFLPGNANTRSVLFVPPTDNLPARVILGSENEDTDTMKEFMEAMIGDVTPQREVPLLSGPVGCLLTEEDLGGWVRSDDAPVGRGQGVGKLDQRKEKFDPVDDCDGEFITCTSFPQVRSTNFVALSYSTVEPFLRFG